MEEGEIVCACLPPARPSRDQSQFSQSSDRNQSTCLNSPHSPETGDGENGFVPVRSPAYSFTHKQANGIFTTGATVCRDNPPTAQAAFNPSAGCGDVVTKPKLDKHRGMCNKSFDCIDCSKRFETPADYKGHTSCISEAEKYQKTVYNGGVSE